LDVDIDLHFPPLEQLGVKSKADLAYLTDKDLIEKGYTVVDARKLLA
jgi:hypothetical protein